MKPPFETPHGASGPAPRAVPQKVYRRVTAGDELTGYRNGDAPRPRRAILALRRGGALGSCVLPRVLWARTYHTVTTRAASLCGLRARFASSRALQTFEIEACILFFVLGIWHV